MKEVEELLISFFQAELDVYLARPNRDFNEFNRRLAIMDAFCTDSVKTTFGLMYATAPFSEERYQLLEKAAPPNKRTLFLIRKYNTKKFGVVYRGYLNDVNGFLTYMDSLFVREINGKLMIFSKFTYGYGRSGSRKEHWFFSGGGEEFKESALGKPIETYRLTEPSICKEMYGRLSKGLDLPGAQAADSAMPDLKAEPGICLRKRFTSCSGHCIWR